MGRTIVPRRRKKRKRGVKRMRASHLFVFLRRKWFEAFADGSKTVEWRRYGRCWNEGTIQIGRPAWICLGYTKTRIERTIVGFSIVPLAQGPQAAREIYPDAEFLIAIEFNASP